MGGQWASRQLGRCSIDAITRFDEDEGGGAVERSEKRAASWVRVALVGVLLLLGGLFAPLANQSIPRELTVSGYELDGGALIGLAAFSVVLILTKRHRWLLPVGVFSLAVIVLSFVSRWQSEMEARVSSEAAVAGPLYVDPVPHMMRVFGEVPWAQWAVLLAGASLVLAAGLAGWPASRGATSARD